jgi:hydroxypyruvate reductase
MPNRDSFLSAHTALTLIREADPANTFCFFLISGGASAMMELPYDSAISFEDTIALNRALVHSGAAITDINCIRKHFSAIKGGRLGLAAARIPNLSILVSDVPAGHLDALSSGPTVPDPSTIADCRSILSRSKLLPQLPPAVRDFFTNPELPETPKPDSFSPQVITLLSDHDLANSASILAESHGFTAFIDTSCDDLDYRIAAERLLTRFRALRREHRKVCLIAPGEVTVQLPTQKIPNTQGGRNQHFALYAATLLTPEDGNTTIFSAGSDGIDGNSPFAGAVLDYDTLHTASPTAAIEALNNFDSSTFLHTLNATVTTGPTGNNLRDLRLFLAD